MAHYGISFDVCHVSVDGEEILLVESTISYTLRSANVFKLCNCILVSITNSSYNTNTNVIFITYFFYILKY